MLIRHLAVSAAAADDDDDGPFRFPFQLSNCSNCPQRNSRVLVRLLFARRRTFVPPRLDSLAIYYDHESLHSSGIIIYFRHTRRVFITSSSFADYSNIARKSVALFINYSVRMSSV